MKTPAIVSGLIAACFTSGVIFLGVEVLRFILKYTSLVCQ